MHVLTIHIQPLHLVYNSITYYAWVQFSIHTYSVHLALNYIMLFISVMYLTIHELELWPMCWHILHTLPIVFPINWMPSFSTRTLHQEYNFVVFISVSKKVAVQVLFKGRNILVPVVHNLPISNPALVSYMTSFTDIHSYNKFLSFISLVITP